MSVFDKAKAKAEQLLGRAEELYGQSHGDAAATLDGEARRIEGEVDEEAAEREEAARRHGHEQHGDEGLAGSR